MKRRCYFYNIGTVYDKNNKQEIEDCWNCNPNNCKSDNLNGLWCDDYGAVFNKNFVKDILKKEIDNYLKCGVKNAYAYYKEVIIDLPKSEWEDFDNYLIENELFNSKKDILKNGYFTGDWFSIVDDYFPNWEQPDYSMQIIDGKVVENKLKILKENEINPDILEFAKKLYGSIKDREEYEKI